MWKYISFLLSILLCLFSRTAAFTGFTTARLSTRAIGFITTTVRVTTRTMLLRHYEKDFTRFECTFVIFTRFECTFVIFTRFECTFVIFTRCECTFIIFTRLECTFIIFTRFECTFFKQSELKNSKLLIECFIFTVVYTHNSRHIVLII